MFDKHYRTEVERGLRPVGSRIQGMGVTANQLTALGLLLSAGAALAIAQGWLILGAVGLAASAIPDLLDGAVAKASGTASPRGAFFDSVADRVSDSLVLGGVAWYLGSVDGGHAAVLPLAVLAASSLVSYERARAESLGFSARGGLMERAERMGAIGLGLIFSAVMVPVLWITLALTLVTAVHRFAMVWRQATPKPQRAAGASARWKAWRPGTGFSGADADQRLRGWRASRAAGDRPRMRRRARTGPP